MNTTQAREIPISTVLQNLGCEPTKSNEIENWYLSPFRLEKSASFKLNKKLNRWYDHGEQKGGNVIDLVIQKFGFSVAEALTYLEKFDTFSSFHTQIFEAPQIEKTNPIKKIISVQHLALIQYLKSRGITNYIKAKNLKEIHYMLKGKNYFALGFSNNSGGFEVRSKYAKICLGKKDISIIHNESKTLRIYEGFFDYLSFIQIRENLIVEESDYLILNSVALLVKNISVLSDYDFIELYLDNDTIGDKYTSLIMGKFKNVKDCRVLFHGFKDLNECLGSGSEIKDRI